jgi:putative PIN family toxin of toxin-antitoxin system
LEVVLDTNVLVSGIGWEGPAARILRACRAGRFSLVTSNLLLEELVKVLSYPRLRVIAQHPDLPVILKWLYAPERIVFPQRTLHVISADPSDNHILEAALEGDVDTIISGDEHLLNLKSFGNISVVSPAAFCRKWNL